MIKKTLLQIVQNILSAMDSDEVNSISDTVESLQVAEIVRETYEELITTLDIPERRSLVQLEALGNINRPNYLKIPDLVKEVLWLRYNDKELTYLPPEPFIRYLINTGGQMEIEDFERVKYRIETDRDPKYWTSFDDEYIVFSSFDRESESTLQESNSLAYALINTPFEMDDDYIPPLDDNLVPLLLAEAKAACFVNLKQTTNLNEEKRARRQLVRVQNELARTTTGRPIDRLPNYGRRR